MRTGQHIEMELRTIVRGTTTCQTRGPFKRKIKVSVDPASVKHFLETQLFGIITLYRGIVL